MQNKAAAGATKQVTGAEQTWAAPNTMAQLMDVLKTPSKLTGGAQFRIIAGNTGSGRTFRLLGCCRASIACLQLILACVSTQGDI